MERGLALAASAVFVVRLLPQPVRLARSGVAAGVSPLAALNAVLSATAWLAYGWSRGLAAVWVVSVIALVPLGWQALLLRRTTTRSHLAGAALWAAAMVVAFAAGWSSAVLSLSVVVNNGPQVLAVLRSHDLAGVSSATWKVAIIDAVAWGVYGVAIGDAALSAYATTLSASALVVLHRLRSAPAPAPASVEGAVMSPVSA